MNHILDRNSLDFNFFLIKRSELEKRFDPLYYGSDLTKFNSGNFPSVTLSSVILSVKSGVGAGKQDQADESGVIQIRPTNMDENGLLKFKRNVYLPKDSKYDKVKVNDVLFNNTNSQELVGKTAILKEVKELYFSNHITRIRVNEKKIIPDFLWIILNLYQKHKIFFSICTNWNNQSGIGLELLKSLRIPLPDIITQQKVVDLNNFAYKQKKEKSKESKLLLKNIDIHLLDQLGISLHEKDNSLNGRINKNVRLKDLTGGRFDPMLYDKNTVLLKESIINVDKNKFDVKPLKNFIIQSIAGDWGFDENDVIDIDKYKKCLVIRATEFDNDFNLKLDNSRVKYRFIKKDKLKKIDIKINDLLIEKSGGSPDQPVGRISILKDNIVNGNDICYSNFIHKIRVDESKLDPKYLFCFLKTIHNVKLTESMQSQTNGIRNLIMGTYFNQSIIIPIKDNGEYDVIKQQVIANNIEDMRDKAKKLQEESKEVLAKAKLKIENILLG